MQIIVMCLFFLVYFQGDVSAQDKIRHELNTKDHRFLQAIRPSDLIKSNGGEQIIRNKEVKIPDTKNTGCKIRGIKNNYFVPETPKTKSSLSLEETKEIPEIIKMYRIPQINFEGDAEKFGSLRNMINEINEYKNQKKIKKMNICPNCIEVNPRINKPESVDSIDIDDLLDDDEVMLNISNCHISEEDRLNMEELRGKTIDLLKLCDITQDEYLSLEPKGCDKSKYVFWFYISNKISEL